jgi:hypothetical protein
VNDPVTLARLLAVIDASGVPERLEALLPVGVRSRQLSVRTLLAGILLTLADGRPAHLSRVHGALVGLEEENRRRLGVVCQSKHGPHTLTYRQVEYTFSLLEAVLSKDVPDGAPKELLQEILDALLEASVGEKYTTRSSSLAIDWTDIESFSTRRTKKDGTYADKEASWGHRKGGGPGEKDELFFGYYLSLATMITDDAGAQVPELVRRMALTSPHHDPVPALVEVLERLVYSGVTIGDVVADSGYAYRVPEHFALRVRALGASLVMDLHPSDRGTQGTHGGAICFNGALYCPATPKALFLIEPLSRQASEEETKVHDAHSAELCRYKLGKTSACDADGYHRVACPAVLGKLRCPARQASMALCFSRPEIAPPSHLLSCCVQKTITVPPTVNAKTAQRYDYPSAAHRRSYARRSAVERSNARIKDPATTDVARGWCRLMALVPMGLLLACGLVVRNLAVADAFEERQVENARRRAAGMAPKTRRRRRKPITELVVTASIKAPT